MGDILSDAERRLERADALVRKIGEMGGMLAFYDADMVLMHSGPGHALARELFERYEAEAVAAITGRRAVAMAMMGAYRWQR